MGSDSPTLFRYYFYYVMLTSKWERIFPFKLTLFFKTTYNIYINLFEEPNKSYFFFYIFFMAFFIYLDQGSLLNEGKTLNIVDYSVCVSIYIYIYMMFTLSYFIINLIFKGFFFISIFKLFFTHLHFLGQIKKQLN